MPAIGVILVSGAFVTILLYPLVPMWVLGVLLIAYVGVASFYIGRRSPIHQTVAPLPREGCTNTLVSNEPVPGS
jgi:hypothetical protein